MSLFADDTDLYLEANLECVSAVLNEINTFGSLAGCKGNLNKTKCIPLGKARLDREFLDTLTSLHGSDFIAHEFTALGISFNNSGSLIDISNNNYWVKLNKSKAWATTWVR